MAKRQPSEVDPKKVEQAKKALATGVNYTLKGLLQSAKAIAKTGIMTEDEAKAIINGAIDEFAQAN